MAGLRFSVSLCLVLGLAAVAQAQQDESGWVASADARAFRMRVAQLAVIYGDSRGIDPRGLTVTGRRSDGAQTDCGDVEIVVLAGERELLRERMRACRHGASGQSLRLVPGAGTVAVAVAARG